MAGAHVKVTLDRRVLNPFIVNVTDQSALRAARKVARRAQSLAPRATGRLAKSIVPRLEQRGVVTTYTVGSNVPYASYQEFGTGPIYPVRAKVLRFKPKGSNAYVFAKHTRGVPARHYMRDAAATLTVADFL